MQFARRGMNVVLISSSYDQLVTIVSELRECLMLQYNIIKLSHTCFHRDGA
jgi:short-subunit dehydrogenase